MQRELRQFKSTFNSGVLLTDLSSWNEQTYNQIRHYFAIDANSNYRLYNLGDETIFNLIFKQTYLPLDQTWNCWGYGQPHWIAKLLKLRCKLEKVNILHWSGGHHKPWQSDHVTYSALWRSYLPENLYKSSPQAAPKVTLSRNEFRWPAPRLRQWNQSEAQLVLAVFPASRIRVCMNLCSNQPFSKCGLQWLFAFIWRHMGFGYRLVW